VYERERYSYHFGLAEALGAYAHFVDTVLRDRDRAQVLYERALAADPFNLRVTSRYDAFLAAQHETPPVAGQDDDRRGAGVVPPSRDDDPISMIERLAKLRDAGVISEAEFVAKRKEPLGRI
jgi:hypothetical protein